jgi:hypothetical protein
MTSLLLLLREQTHSVHGEKDCLEGVDESNVHTLTQTPPSPSPTLIH